MLKSRPLLFSAPMITALLDGRKSQTRRIVKPQPYSNGFRFDGDDFLCHNDYLPPSAMLMDIGHGKSRYTTSDIEGWESSCPYGQNDEFLWVRETWRTDGPQSECTGPSDVRFAASVDEAEWAISKWKPSIFMPRWASRITLRITDVRVERLHEITEANAIAEGVEFESADPPFYYLPGIHPHSITAVGVEESGSVPHAVRSYAKLWDHINGSGYWARNDWVWVISFATIKANVDDVLPGEAL